MTTEEREIYIKIREHLAKLHEDYFNSPNFDGHHKSNEGYVGLLYSGGNWFEYQSANNYIHTVPKLVMVEVYSYLFGPSRLHTYDTLEEAWNDVKTW